MKGIALISFILFLANISCNSPSGPPQDIYSDVLLQGIEISQTNYDTLLVQVKADLPDLFVKRVNQIFIGTIQDNKEVVSDTIDIQYVSGENNSLLAFNKMLHIPDNLVNVEVFVKFILSDNKVTEYKKTIDLLTFPYTSTKVYIYWAWFIPHRDIQDFSLNGDLIYYHPLGPEGVYEYNIKTNVTRPLVNLPGGDFIDSNSKYIIIDDEHYALMRFNINKDTVDLWKPLSKIVGLSSNSNIDIHGVAASDSLFYVLYSPDNQHTDLAVLSDSLTLISNQQFNRDLYYIKYYDNTLFGFDYSTNTLVEYDLSTKQFLSNKPLPTENSYGFKISGYTFFFSDYDKHIVGFLPLADILNYNGPLLSKKIKRKTIPENE